MPMKQIEVNLNIPGFAGIKGTWEPNKKEKEAAWELYVELITRITVVPLKNEEGVLREALNSIYSIVQTTRDILRKYGPSIARPRKKNEYSFGILSIIILNYQLRPLLSKWHPKLQEYESKRNKNTSIKEHEDKWKLNSELRKELDETRKILIEYSKHLAKVANVEQIFNSKIKPKKRKK